MIELNTIIPNAYSTMIQIDEFDTHYNDCEGAGICDQIYYLEFEAECQCQLKLKMSQKK